MDKQLLAELEEWRASDIELLTVNSIKLHPALQPRDANATRYLDQRSEHRASEHHTGSLRLVLEGDVSRDLPPLLVAKVDRQKFVVDGHHRLHAYRLAGRQTVPVKLRRLTLHRAMLLSTIVNTTERALPLSPGQKSESLWRFVIDATDGGRRGLAAAGTSQRKAMELYGVRSKRTMGSMIEHVALARQLRDGGGVPEHDRNPVTGYPSWRFVCKSLRPDEATMEPERDEAKRAKTAGMLASLLDEHGPNEFIAIVREVWREAVEETEASGPWYESTEG